MTASERIAQLEAQLAAARRVTASLRAQLAAQGIEPVDRPPPWSAGLTPNDLALMQMLLAAWPRAVRMWDLADNLPKRDHTLDRSDECIRTHVHRVRAALGKGAIERIRGVGYRCSDDFYGRHGGRGNGGHHDGPDNRAAG